MESRVCRRGKGLCWGVVTAFHPNEPVLALKVRVAAHSPPWWCRGLCTTVALQQTKEDKMASQQLWLRVLGFFLLLFAFQGEFSSFRPYSWFPFPFFVWPLNIHLCAGRMIECRVGGCRSCVYFMWNTFYTDRLSVQGSREIQNVP